MASEKLTALSAIPTVSAADVVYVVDTSDTTDDAAGSSKKVTLGNLGARYLIQTITLSTAGEFDFSSIPSGFSRLLLKGVLRTNEATTAGVVHSFLNTDTTISNYHSQRISGINDGSSTNEYSEPRVCFVPGASSASGLYTQVDMCVEEYAGSHRKTIGALSHVPRDTGFLESTVLTALSSITASVTRIRVRSDTHPTNGLLGTLRLYGEF